jgi:membrane-bound ClpP family serine protease
MGRLICLLVYIHLPAEQDMRYKTMKAGIVAAGIVLIIIALILGGLQLLHIYNIYGSTDNKWYFYGGVGIVGLIGIIVAAYGLMKKESPTTPKQ